MERAHDQPVPGQQVVVRIASGVLIAITQPVDSNLRVGQRVFIRGSGESARGTPQ